MSWARAAVAALFLVATVGCESHDSSTRAVMQYTQVTTATTSSGTTTTTSSTTTTTSSTTTTTAVPRLGAPVTAIGDSVMIDATPALLAAIPRITIDAAESRSALPGPGLLASLEAQGRLGAAIVVGLGSNGGMSVGIVDELLQVAQGRRVVMVTSRCPYCSWTPRGNAVIRSSCVQPRQCFVADWDTLAQAHPDWFASDGVHIPSGGPGARAYAQLVRAQL